MSIINLLRHKKTTRLQNAILHNALPGWMVGDLAELVKSGGSGYVVDGSLFLEMLKEFECVTVGGTMGFGLRHVLLNKTDYDFLKSRC